MKLTLERLKYLFTYDSGSGLFVRKCNQGHQKNGQIAGCRNGAGYVSIGIDGKRYLAHRLAWFYCHGVWPDRIDHRDETRHHNWIDNLRPATHAQNLWNSSNRKRRVYPKGVSRNGTKFCARLSYNWKTIWLGNFKTIKEASDAYVEASKKYHKEFSIYN